MDSTDGPSEPDWGPPGALGRALWIAPGAAFLVVLAAAVVWPGFAPDRVGGGIALMAGAVVLAVIGVTHGMRHRSTSPIAVADSRRVRGLRSRGRSPSGEERLDDPEVQRLVPIAHRLGRQTTAGVINAAALILFWIGYALTSHGWLVVVLVVVAAVGVTGTALMLRDLGRLRRFVAHTD